MLFRTVIACTFCATTAFAAPAAPAQPAKNPMWESGYSWNCTIVSKMVCERGGQCASVPVEEPTFSIDYENNQVDFKDGTTKMRRHYNQTVVNSPLQSEVKIELKDNRVLWLTAVDASFTYSSVWHGSLVVPKAGVVLSELSSVYCSPKSR